MDSLAVVVSFVAAGVLTSLFVLSSRKHSSPLLDPALLRIKSFSVASLATLLAGIGFYSYLLTNILWLQYVWHYSVLQAGLALDPGGWWPRSLPPSSAPGPTGTGTVPSSSRGP